MKIKVTVTRFHGDVLVIAGQSSYEDENGATVKRIPTDTNIDAGASADKVSEILRLAFTETVRRAVPSEEIEVEVAVADEDGANLFTAPDVRLRGGSPAGAEENI